MPSLNQRQPYSEEFSQFLTAQARLLDARMPQGEPVMPLEFKLMHPRRVTWSSRVKQPDGQTVHFVGFRDATPEEELWHRIHSPEHGLSTEDVIAYRKSKLGPMVKFFARLKFWPTQVKDADAYEVPAVLSNQSD